MIALPTREEPKLSGSRMYRQNSSGVANSAVNVTPSSGLQAEYMPSQKSWHNSVSSPTVNSPASGAHFAPQKKWLKKSMHTGASWNHPSNADPAPIRSSMAASSADVQQDRSLYAEQVDNAGDGAVALEPDGHAAVDNDVAPALINTSSCAKACTAPF